MYMCIYIYTYIHGERERERREGCHLNGEKGNIKSSSIVTNTIAMTLLVTNGCNHTSVPL